MAELTSLERASLGAILAELKEDRNAIEQQLRHASAISRENTGGGFFTELTVFDAKPLDRTGLHLGENVWISVEGLDYGLGLILHFKAGLPVLLEGHAVAPEDTSAIDFERVRFAVVDAPGPFTMTGP